MERLHYPIFFFQIKVTLISVEKSVEGELSFSMFSTNVGLLASYLSLKAVRAHASSTYELEYIVNVLIVLSLR